VVEVKEPNESTVVIRERASSEEEMDWANTEFTIQFPKEGLFVVFFWLDDSCQAKQTVVARYNGTVEPTSEELGALEDSST
jgi:hypothetical protein